MRLLSFLLVIALAGGHLACLQAVAWAGMFIDRVQTAPSVGEAVASTVDGSRPCALCKAVDELADDARKPATPADKQMKKADKAVVGAIRLCVPAAVSVSYRAGAGSVPPSRGIPPELRPPIA